MPTVATIAKAGKLHAQGNAIKEADDFRVFRVQGADMDYTVLIHPEMADVCTCLAGKTHPEVMCKHVALAYLYIGAEGEEVAA